ncbi:MAG: orotate phosphoribosyltransferase [Candidatus Eremiobacteraeota bacterium]|nr:orotate phosphoribosyltransferase [Candidatus Eremiobacteraeota bacterium]MBC5828044.1 orotate phosphoribosyltransferase [Candidatus Eremiobacteraeota bacterium]
MTAPELLAILERSGAMLQGHFLLSSGRHSDRFIQKFRIFEDPAVAEKVCGALAAEVQAAAPQVIVSAAVGGVIPGYIVAKALGIRNMFVEKMEGRPVLRRGFQLARGERVVIVEDVMTTGRSAQEVAAVVRSLNADVVAIGAIVKRGPVESSPPVTALLDLPLSDYAPDACPLCSAGVALQDPGSRRVGA